MQAVQQEIENHYNTWAERYSDNARVDDLRANKIVHLLHQHVWLLPGHGWIEIGCRAGGTLALAAERELLRPSGHWGIDPSERMVSLARDHYPRLAHWVVGEAENLPLGDESARGAIVNGGWQWLCRAEGGRGLRRALEETRRVLGRNSLLALAHPGGGSDSPLQGAVLETTLENPAWAREKMPENPLGATSLQEILRIAEVSGFQAIYGEECYEPTMYANLSLYLEEIAYTSQAAWLWHIEENHRQAAWEEVSERLSEEIRDGFLRPIFSVYLLLRAI